MEMTTKEQVIAWSEQADDYADKKLQCEGEYHPDWHEVRDAYFATLIRNAALEDAAQKCKKLEVAIDGGGNAYYRPADARQCVAAIESLKEPV